MRNPSLALLLAAMLVPAAIASCSDDSGPSDQPDSSTSGGKTAAGGGGSTGTGGASASGGKGGGGAGGKASSGGGGGEDADGSAGDASVEAGTDTGGRAGTGGGSSTGGNTDIDAGDAGNRCVPPRCQPAYPKVLFPDENAYTDAKATLGKILFWDQQVGQLDTMACGSCHRSNSGGSVPASAEKHLPGVDGILDANPGTTSDDIRGALGTPVCDASGHVSDSNRQSTTRKPPSYLDAMFAGQIFWDGRAGFCKPGDGVGGCFYDPDLPAGSPPVIKAKVIAGNPYTPGGALEAQASGPPVNASEMSCAGQNWTKIAQKLKGVTTPLKLATAQPLDMKNFIAANNNSYPQMFKAAFGSTAKVKDSDPDDVINTRRIVFAIATHERRLTSNQTPYDRWNAGDDSAMTPAQIRGFTNFVGKARCSFCHAPPLFTDNSFHNIGFHKPAIDVGRKAITGQSSDNGAFRTATIRNVKLREAQGLLHNGIGPGKDLQTLMLLYRQGGFRDDTDIVPFIDPGLIPVVLNAVEIDELVDFMRNALTDPRVERQCPPFDRPAIDGETAMQGDCSPF